ncbi:calponin homology domain-containing protein [Limtongia smithiae]|uniref:calponin homology domain-containing protein n=1 Tax=Limtongia smithiae TaxID=1125753 RepID=UPI0034CE8A05
MGESRQELIAWMNDLLQLNLTEVNQCGTGAPLCQIFDSIYGDLPMAKVKFNVNSEYQYISNFKVLQAAFLRHKINKTVPVERLTKCKFQDNLEFLQWTKKFWDMNFPGGDYDPIARRKGQSLVSGAPARAPSVVSNRKASGSSTTSNGNHSSINNHHSASANTSTVSSGLAPRTRTPSASVQISQLQADNAALREHAEALERERDFYFNKLRDIEILVTAVADEDAEQIERGERPLDPEKDMLIKQIQDILYTTEEGFEIPDQVAELDEETF